MFNIIPEIYPIINQEILKNMKNIPRLFCGDDIRTGMEIAAPRDAAHYLGRVMRTKQFLAFGGGDEFLARISDDGRTFIIGDKTAHADPSGDITLAFAPIRRTDDVINMATQLGIARFLPVITEHTVAHNINWDRMRKIATEAAEQSGRNSVPEILPPVKFADLDVSNIAFADERTTRGGVAHAAVGVKTILVGPEGGFSDAEFAALDANGARGVSLGKTILRAELAAAVAVVKIGDK